MPKQRILHKSIYPSINGKKEGIVLQQVVKMENFPAPSLEYFFIATLLVL
jgi:hypothetical protein